jgi:hypothetical protein
MSCRICKLECEGEFCGWCRNRIDEFVKSNVNHSCINITWGCGRIAWSDAYYLGSFIRENGIREVLEFGTGLSTEIFAILGLRIVTCDVLKNHSDLFAEHQALKGIADVIWYEYGTLPDFEVLYPGKRWEFVFVDGPQARDLETEAAMRLSSKFITLHDPGLSKHNLNLPGWEQLPGAWTFKKI